MGIFYSIPALNIRPNVKQIEGNISNDNSNENTKNTDSNLYIVTLRQNNLALSVSHSIPVINGILGLFDNFEQAKAYANKEHKKRTEGNFWSSIDIHQIEVNCPFEGSVSSSIHVTKNDVIDLDLGYVPTNYV